MTEGTRYAVEMVMARMDRTIKRLWIVIILLIVLLVASNCAWLVYEAQYEDEVTTTTTKTTQTVDQDGDSNSFVGGDVNGTSDSNDNNDNRQ